MYFACLVAGIAGLERRDHNGDLLDSLDVDAVLGCLSGCWRQKYWEDRGEVGSYL